MATEDHSPSLSTWLTWEPVWKWGHQEGSSLTLSSCLEILVGSKEQGFPGLPQKT